MAWHGSRIRATLLLVPTLLLVSSPVVLAQSSASENARACGRVIAYAEGRDINDSQLMAVSEDGGPSHIVWDDGLGGKSEIDPSWSSDGRAVAFVGRSIDAAGPIDNVLYVLRQTGSAPQIILRQPLYSLRFPDWAPNNKRIAYATGVGALPNHLNPSAIRVVNADGSNDRLVAALPTDTLERELRIVDVVWSPRGDLLLVTAVTRTYEYTMWSVRPDGDPRLTVLSDARDGDPSYGYPAFLPGGFAVLIAKSDVVDGVDQGTSTLMLADPALRRDHPISHEPGLEEFADFGPTPLKAVFLQFQVDSGDSAVAILNLWDGSTKTLVARKDGVSRSYPDWQPRPQCGPWSIR